MMNISLLLVSQDDSEIDQRIWIPSGNRNPQPIHDLSAFEQLSQNLGNNQSVVI